MLISIFFLRKTYQKECQYGGIWFLKIYYYHTFVDYIYNLTNPENLTIASDKGKYKDVEQYSGNFRWRRNNKQDGH